MSETLTITINNATTSTLEIAGRTGPQGPPGEGISDLGTAARRDIAESGNAASDEVVLGNDSRLSDGRTPTAHATTHKTGGSDALKLNELAAPTGAVDLNSQRVTNASDPVGNQDLDTKAARNAAIAIETAARIAADAAKADLVGGVVPTSQIPALAISETFPVSSQAAMLALSAQRGDIAIRSDLGKSFVLSSDSPSTLADWLELSASGKVTSVNNQVGAVTLGYADVGADASGAAATAQAAAQAYAAGLVDDLSGVTNASAARTALGLGTAATKNAPASGDAASAEVVLGNDSRFYAQSIVNDSGTSRTLAATDIGKLIVFSNSSSIALACPQDSDATIPVGSIIEGIVTGTGQLTASAGTGATLNGTPTKKTRGQYSRVAWQKIAANTWVMFGDVAAS